MLSYPFENPKISGLLVRRLNRFVVEVELEGRRKEAYLANPGRLWELLLPNTELLLNPAQPGCKIPYTVLACRKDGLTILLHTHLTNKIVRNLIDEGRLTAFRDYRVIKEEPACGRQRFDLLLEQRQSGLSYYLEVKSTTLFAGRIAMFPDAVTGRGAGHLTKLSELSAKGIKGGCLFVVMNPLVDYFMPAYHIDYNFAGTFLSVKKGVQLQAVAIGFDPGFTTVDSVKALEIPYEFLEKEQRDRGVYLLLIKIAGPKAIAAGSLGEISFKEGYYVYAGSAMNSLSKRINRHRRRIKKKRWHIDYLTAEAEVITPIAIITGDDLECELAAAVREISDHQVTGFGSSDCNCPAHLFYFSGNPLQNRAFIDLIQYYRIQRLEKGLK